MKANFARAVREAVGQVVDPETGMTFGEMQLITNVKEEEPGVFKVEFVPSSPFCPIAFKLAKRALFPHRR